MWFMNSRSEPVGGDVCAVRICDETLSYPTYSEFMKAIGGRHVLIGIHGFNVHQAGAIDHLRVWNKLLQLDSSSVFIGILWPGDSAWVGALEYPFAARGAEQAGRSLADFIGAELTSVLSLSFVSHSLGARVALQTIKNLSSAFTVRRLIMMAPAVDDDCLTGEFAIAARKIKDISILASGCDEVLELAFPLGNPLSGIFSRGHPYWHAALGREGPADYLNVMNIHRGWLLPNSWKVGHSSYLPPPFPYPVLYNPVPFPMPQCLPPPLAGAPPTDTPKAFEQGGIYSDWQSSWTAAFTSTRFR